MMKRFLENYTQNYLQEGTNPSAQSTPGLVKTSNALPLQQQPESTYIHIPSTTYPPVVFKRSPIWSRLIVWVIVLCAGGAVAWAILATYEEAIFATGQLEPQGSVKEVQSPVTGVVNAIYVKDGQKVNKGDLLLRLDPDGQRSELASLEKIRQTMVSEANFYLQQTRLPTQQAYAMSAAANVPQGMLALAESRRALVAETILFTSQLQGGRTSQSLSPDQQLRLSVGLQEEASRASAMQMEADLLNKQVQQNAIALESAQKTVESNQGLLQNISEGVASGAIARVQQVRLEEDLQKAEAEVSRLMKEGERLQVAISQSGEKYKNTVSTSQKDVLNNIATNEKRIAEIDSQFAKAAIDNQKQVAEIDNRLAQAKLTMQYKDLRAPTDGIVFDMKAKAPGFVATLSEPILKLVPAEALVAKVYISNKDIGFVRKGMLVDVRIDSFPFSEYGDVKGSLTWIGSDALQPTEIRPYYHFPAKISLKTQNLTKSGQSLKLQSGMSINVNLKTRQRNVWSIFTEQFTNQVEGVKHLR
jgi:hemolysin D